MPNLENHLDGMPETAPRANQAPIPKVDTTPAFKKTPLLDVLGMKDFQVDQRLLDEALGCNSREAMNGNGFG